jgi:hypothetical protein
MTIQGGAAAAVQDQADKNGAPSVQASVSFELIGTNAKNYKLNRTSYTFDVEPNTITP